MTPEEIRKVVESFDETLIKKEKVQKRLITLSGRDPEQEAILFQRLDYLERIVQAIEYSISEGGVLTTKEELSVDLRIEGAKMSEIGSHIRLTRERVRQLLESAYKKIAEIAGESDVFG